MPELKLYSRLAASWEERGRRRSSTPPTAGKPDMLYGTELRTVEDGGNMDNPAVEEPEVLEEASESAGPAIKASGLGGSVLNWYPKLGSEEGVDKLGRLCKDKLPRAHELPLRGVCWPSVDHGIPSRLWMPLM
jgi:hypothetical protein